MRIGMIGLGKMGANMTERLLKGGHEVVAYDLSADALKQAAAKGAETASDAGRAGREADGRRGRSWVMLPAGKVTDSTVEELAGLFSGRRRHRRRRQLELQGVDRPLRRRSRRAGSAWSTPGRRGVSGGSPRATA